MLLSSSHQELLTEYAFLVLTYQKLRGKTLGPTSARTGFSLENWEPDLTSDFTLLSLPHKLPPFFLCLDLITCVFRRHLKNLWKKTGIYTRSTATKIMCNKSDGEWRAILQMLPVLTAGMGKFQGSRMRRWWPWTWNSPGPNCQVSKCLRQSPTLPPSCKPLSIPTSSFLGQLGTLLPIPTHPTPTLSLILLVALPSPTSPTNQSSWHFSSTLYLTMTCCQWLTAALTPIASQEWRGRNQRTKSLIVEQVAMMIQTQLREMLFL